MLKNNGTKASLRRRLLRQVRAVGRTFLDSLIADELCDDCTDDVLGSDAPDAMGATDCFPSVDHAPFGLGTDFGHIPLLRDRARVAREALRQRVAERAAQAAPEPQPACKSREYPMGLSPNYTSTMERFRDLIQVREEEGGKKVVYLDPMEATPELLNALKSGSEPTLVPAGSTVYVTGRPQVLFRPELVSIERDLAPHFMVMDIKIGKNSQFVSSTPIPAEEFAAGNRRHLKLDICQISMDVTVALYNKSGSAQRCPHITIYGPAVE